jgi:tetratricopeptide (TPR) repeat protein
MKTNEQDFRNDIQKLLAGFVDKSEMNDFLQKLRGGAERSNKSLEVINQFYAQQLKVEYSFAKDRMEIDRAITFARKNIISKKFPEFLRKLGQICISHGKINLAYEVIVKAIRESQESNLRAEGLLLLSDVFSRRAEWKRSIAALEEAKDLFAACKNDLGTSKCENLLGSIYGERGDLDKAKVHFENSLLLLDPEREKELAASVESNLGIIENILGNYQKAISYFENSQRKLECLGNFRRLSELKHNIGMVYFNQKNYAEAIDEFDQTIDIAQKEGFLPVLGLSYLNKANALIALEDFESASQFADKAMEVCHQIDDKLSVADIYKTKSVIERKLKNYSLAESYLQTSLRLNEKMKNILNIAETSYELASLYGDLNRHEEKQSYLREALKRYREVQQSERVKKIEQLMTHSVS